MITPSMIVEHLGRYLPRVTNLFNDEIAATSASVGSGNVLTVVTPDPHGLSVGSPVTVSSGLVEVKINSAIVVNGFATFTTTSDHDLTEPRQADDLREITLAGFSDSAWNGTFEISDIPNRLNFTVPAPSGASAPTLNGGEVLRIERSVSVFGIQTVSTVPDANTITINLGSNTPDMNGVTLHALKIVTAVRVSGAADIKRAEDMYTRRGNNELWAFVVMTDLDVSKDRHSINDAYATFSVQDEMRLRLLQNFGVLVFFPTDNSVSGATAQELAFGEVYRSLLQVLYGFTGFATDEDGSTFATVSTGHGITEYRKAYYMQAYEWQTPVDITVDNGWGFWESVAFRDIGGSLSMNTLDNEEKFTLAIDLDDEPL